MRRTRVMALLAAGGLVVAGCSAPGPAEVTFFADGKTVNATPAQTFNPLTREQKDDRGAYVQLKVRPGRPIQISVPGEVAKTPWSVTTQYVDAKGEPQPPVTKLITSLDQYAYTVTPPHPTDQVAVVEVAQIGVVNNPQTPDNPGLFAIATWSLQIENPAS